MSVRIEKSGQRLDRHSQSPRGAQRHGSRRAPTRWWRRSSSSMQTKRPTWRCSGARAAPSAPAGTSKPFPSLDQNDPVGKIDFPKDGGKAPRGPLGPSRLELSKPVIAAVEGPAVAGGMELAMWCDVRVMAESAYFGVYCRRWGVPLIDGGTVRLPRLVGMGKALEIIMTGRKVTAEESYRIGLCEKVVPARQGARGGRGHGAGDRPLPAGVHALRPALGLSRAGANPVREGLESEWATSAGIVKAEGIAGATRFAEGKGRHGDFEDI